MTAKDLMCGEVVAVRPSDSLHDAALLMQAHGLSAALVLGEQGDVVGVISEFDVLRLLLPDYLEQVSDLSFLPDDFTPGPGAFAQIAHVLVAQAMRTQPLITVEEDEPLLEVIRLIVKHHINYLPVVREGKVVGVILRAHLVRAIVNSETETCDAS